MDEKKVVSMEPVIDLLWTTEDEPTTEIGAHNDAIGVGDACGASAVSCGGCSFFLARFC